MPPFKSKRTINGAALWKRTLLAGIIIIFSVATAVATTVLTEVNQSINIFKDNVIAIPALKEPGALDNVEPSGAQTILVLGSDHRFADSKTGANSDTMILVRLDPNKKVTAVLSIPRDLRVNIPGYGALKINAAYQLGGAKLTVKTIRSLMGIPINHVVNINFGGFTRVVDRLGCIYTDVDQRYYHSNANVPPTLQYSEINIKPGYQLLCGEQALTFVRYRHTDTDLVRAARQKLFLGEAREQIGKARIFNDRKTLLKIIATSTETDLTEKKDILSVLKLATLSAQNPIEGIAFAPVQDSQDSGTDLIVAPETLNQLRKRFFDATSSASASKPVQKNAKRSKPRAPDGNLSAKIPARMLARQLRMQVYYPALATRGAQYGDVRAYTIADRNNKKYQAYRMVVSISGANQYYGVQGTTWKNPPILDGPHGTRVVGSRRFNVYRDGSRVRLISWTTKQATYWISNTLLASLSSRQMYALAESLTRSRA